ncbi:recombination mediator RecR [Patescibacteria group bacterium]
MNVLPKAITKLIESFQKLPGIGPKSAQRLVYYLLHVPQEELDGFANNLTNLKDKTVLCSICRIVAENDPCSICSSLTRDKSTICVVEQSTDVISIEKTGKYNGVYHVLHGAIDPLNNIGPDEIFISDLFKRLKNINQSTEIILATNSNMEGEATSLYIQKKLQEDSFKSSAKLKITRLAHGIPVGADIEYADEVTLTRAIEGRREY